MRQIILSFCCGGIAGCALTRMGVNIYIVLGICFCIGAIIGWFKIWK